MSINFMNSIPPENGIQACTRKLCDPAKKNEAARISFHNLYCLNFSPNLHCSCCTSHCVIISINVQLYVAWEFILPAQQNVRLGLAQSTAVYYKDGHVWTLVIKICRV